jgi:hypothetical protein
MYIYGNRFEDLFESLRRTKDSFIKSSKNELTVMWAFFMPGIYSP